MSHKITLCLKEYKNCKYLNMNPSSFIRKVDISKLFIKYKCVSHQNEQCRCKIYSQLLEQNEFQTRHVHDALFYTLTSSRTIHNTWEDKVIDGNFFNTDGTPAPHPKASGGAIKILQI